MDRWLYPIHTRDKQKKKKKRIGAFSICFGIFSAEIGWGKIQLHISQYTIYLDPHFHNRINRIHRIEKFVTIFQIHSQIHEPVTFYEFQFKQNEMGFS